MLPMAQESCRPFYLNVSTNFGSMNDIVSSFTFDDKTVILETIMLLFHLFLDKKAALNILKLPFKSLIFGTIIKKLTCRQFEYLNACYRILVIVIIIDTVLVYFVPYDHELVFQEIDLLT